MREKCKRVVGYEPVQLLDIAQNEAAAKTINTWVEEKTKDKIKDLIQKDDLNALTRLVLLNAIYFKGNWAHQFKKENTKSEPFYLNDVDHVDVQMMHQMHQFLYRNDKNLDAQVLKLPYENRDFSLIIILPNQRNGIKDLEKKLVNVDLTNITQKLHMFDVTLSLPRFKVEQTIDLTDALTKLGLGVIFDQSKANFRGMVDLSPSENLSVSKIVQKAFIEVNEEGTEAAAVTSGELIMSENPTVEFHVDHPFIYLMVAKHPNSPHNHNNVLFYGKLTQPTSSSSDQRPTHQEL